LFGPSPGEPGRVLLDVPRYDFNWQHAYRFAEPLPWTDGMRLACTATYDNSAENPVNPDPAAVVRWGDQTWEEMMIAFVEVAVPVDPNPSQRVRGKLPLSAEQHGSAERTAEELIRRFDRNGDGMVQRLETPDAFANFAFGQFDRNGDKAITREEAVAAAIEALRRKIERRGL
jgi:hypothetical protein